MGGRCGAHAGNRTPALTLYKNRLSDLPMAIRQPAKRQRR
jgi:hypothetical protein